jgi:hypothetical protein
MRLPHQHGTCMGAGCHASESPRAVPEARPEAVPDAVSDAAPEAVPEAAPDAAQGAGEGAEHLQGPVPLSACSGCHALDLVTTRRAQRLAAPWSVRARFEHALHERDPVSGAAVGCTACHAGVVEADSVAAIPGPPKRACVPCHDGRAAFKLTGHGCARCHGQAAQP